MQLHNRVVPCTNSPEKVVERGDENGKQETQYETVMQALHYDSKWQEEFNLGVRVGLYRIRGDLGSGNFSRVKLAVHQLTKENVALKMVDKGKLDEKTRRMLHQEISTMEQVHHPNIIRLYEVVETYSKVYLAMEYARGGELFHKVTTCGRFEEVVARVLFAQICSAVQHLHERMIIHRDIKAENVFLSSQSRVKLGDFGFSAQLTSGPDEQLNMFCGSPPYAAPELFRDEHYLGGPVDVWALGVLLYFLVIGRMPFRGQNVPSIKAHVLAGSYIIPRYLSREVSDLIVITRRAEMDFHIPRTRRQGTDNFTSLKGRALFNQLPEHIKRKRSEVKEFKRLLRAFLIEDRILKPLPKERPTVTEILASDWLQGVPPPVPSAVEESYVLQPTVSPYKPPTEPPDEIKYSEIERTARDRLEAMGISPALLAAHTSQGSRSHVIGCYRIVIHRIERQLMVFTDTDKLLPAANATSSPTGRRLAICGGETGCWGKKKRKDESARSRACTIL